MFDRAPVILACCVALLFSSCVHKYTNPRGKSAGETSVYRLESMLLTVRDDVVRELTWKMNLVGSFNEERIARPTLVCDDVTWKKILRAATARPKTFPCVRIIPGQEIGIDDSEPFRFPVKWVDGKPTEYEERNVGCVIGVVLKNVLTEIAYADVSLADTVVGNADSAGSRREQPVFRTHRLRTGVEMPLGDWFVIGELLPGDGKAKQRSLTAFRIVSSG